MPSGGDWKALYGASRDGDVGLVRQWLELGADPNDQHPEFGTTRLIAAAERGHLEVVKVLVDSGTDHTIIAAWDGVNAEQAAAENGHTAVVAWLGSR